MDVQCERCKTEYEFDDALVSARGTTVRCTQCGHEFKVRRAEAPADGADRWVVRTTGGQELAFLTLRELQRAILSKHVGRADLLAHGGAQPRPLGTIAELEPFFEGRTSSRPPPGMTGGSGPHRFPPPPAVPQASEPLDGATRRTASWGAPPPPQPQPPPRRPADTLRPPAHGAAAPPPALPPTMSPVTSAAALAPTLVAAQPVVPVSAATPYGSSTNEPVGADPVTHRRPMAAPLPAAVVETPSPLPPPTGVRRVMPSDDEFPHMRGAMPSSFDDDYGVPRRRRVGGWIVAVVLLGAVGVVGWVVAKPYLLSRASGGAAAQQQLDPRAQRFLAEGEKAMSDGDLDVAQEDFDKASALAERDAHVLLDEARLAAAKADVPWLKLRLLPTDAAEETRMTRSQLDDRVGRARQAADDALAAAPDDPAAVRAKIDALRLVGERDAARGYVVKVIAQASQPETAYVLAALDLAEPEPLWPTVIDRLRLAAAGEDNAGRARAALVYALAKSGDVAGARAELAKLDAMTRPYPLLPNLHAFVDKTPAKASLDGGVAANASRVGGNPHGSQGGATTAGGGGEEPVGDEPGAMGEASKAIKKGDWGRAHRIYEALVARDPSDSEALSGIGDCARAQGDSAGAIAAYKRALAVNPSYLPALLGVADTEWASGDHAGAQRAYKDIVDRFPEGTYPAYVKTRAEGPPPAPAPTGAPAAGSAAAGSPAAPTPVSSADQNGL